MAGISGNNGSPPVPGRPDAAALNLDGLRSMLHGLGMPTRDPGTSLAWHPSPNLGQQTIDDLYRSDAIAARIVDTVPDDAISRGVSITVDDEPDAATAIHDAFEELDVLPKLAHMLKLKRKDGGALMLLGTDDVGALEDPLDESAFNSITHLHVLERWGVRRMERDNDPRSKNFGRPRFYEFTTRADADDQLAHQRVHHSRLIVLDGIKISDRTSSDGWGFGHLERAYEPLTGYRSLWGWIRTTFKHFTQTWLSMHSLTELLAKPGGEAALMARLQLMQMARSTLSVVPIDDRDKIIETEVTLTEAAAMLLKAMEDVACAADMPLTKLFGHAPAGLSTDDASGTNNYNESVARVQSGELLRPLNRITDLLCKAKLGPTSGVVPARYQIAFTPLVQMSEKEMAELDRQHAETDAIRVTGGVITAAEARSRLRSDPECPYQIEDDEPVVAAGAGDGAAPDGEPLGVVN